MPSLRQRFSAYPHRGFEVSTVNSGQLTAQEQALFQAGVPLHIIMEGVQAVKAYTTQEGIELPEGYEKATYSSFAGTTGMSNPFASPSYMTEDSAFTSDDFLG
jgi:hypothetical protein